MAGVGIYSCPSSGNTRFCHIVAALLETGVQGVPHLHGRAPFGADPAGGRRLPACMHSHSGTVTGAAPIPSASVASISEAEDNDKGDPVAPGLEGGK